MLGAPGAGKGTQARLIAAKFDLAHISSGDLFRENIKNKTELGELAQSFISKGELVPDEVTIRMVEARLSRDDCANGAVLDGFPRTPPQAKALSDLLEGLGFSINLVPYISVPEEVLVARLSGRCTCREHGHIYHQLFNPPKQPGICDVDGSELYQREDDSAETVRNRINVYIEQTAPLIDHYRQLGLLKKINGDQPIEDVQADMLEALQSVASRKQDR
jgi:adenylate kinase